MKTITPHRKPALLLALVSLLAACSDHQGAQAMVDQARSLEARGDRKGAMIQLKNVIQEDPDNREARLMLGANYLVEGAYPAAEKELRKARELGIAGEEVTPQLAKALLGMGEYQRVLDEIQPTEGMGSAALASIHAARGVAHLALQQLPAAEKEFREAESADADHPETRLGLARLAIAQRKPEDAMRQIEQVISQDNEYLDAWLMKADLLRLTGKTDDAALAYRKATEIDPRNVGAHLSLAAIRLAGKDYASAQEAIDAASRSAPQALGVHYMKAMLAFRQNQLPQANDHLLAVLRAAPDHLPSLLLSGAVNYSLGNYEQAHAHLGKVLEKSSRNAYARKLMAATQLKLRQPKEALETLAPLGISESQDAGVLALAGEAAMALGEHAKATEYFETASRILPDSAAIRTEMALSRLGAGDTDRAMLELEAAADLDSKFHKADVLLVLNHLNRREFDKALSAIADLEKKLPGNPMVENLRGAAYLGKGDQSNARRSFERALIQQGDYFPAAANLAQMDLRENRQDAAKKRFQAILAKNPKHVQSMVALAQLEAKAGKEKESLSLLEKAAKADTQALPPRALLVQYWLGKNDAGKALAYAREAASANPKSASALDLLGRAQMATGDKTSAVSTYRRLAETMPQSAAAQVRLAQALTESEDLAGARQALGQALRLDPKHAEAKALLAGLELKARQYERALATARELQRDQPKSALGFAIEGDVLLSQKQGLAAAKAYETAHGLAPSGGLVVKMYQAYASAGQPRMGEARVTQWLDKHPEDRLVRTFLAEATMKAGDLAKAAGHYETLIKQNPTDLVALNNLAWVYQQLKSPKALGVAEKAYKLRPDSPAVVDTYAWILVEKGDAKKGIELLRQALSKVPDAAEIQWHLAYALHKSGDNQRARQELERLLSSGLSFSAESEARALLQQLNK